MKGVIELPIDTDSDDVKEMESVGIEAMVELYREQQETNRLAISAIKEMIETVVSTIQKDNNARARNEKSRIELDKDRFVWEREQVFLSRSRQCESAKDLTKLSKTPLAAKSSSAAKSKVKGGSGKGKKTT
jgi:hypothetical protein